MPLETGARLGSHEIVGLLGAGGMGEVYLAQDTKLNRRVAIKVLPEAYASDPERIARFHREAQAVAALNHAGIAAIYDLAEADGTKFLVLELIEGDTLADRLRRGPVPPEEALHISKQIVEALEAAHERGVCHRDLKPANIKLTADGTIKVLDFGLAKFLQSRPSAPQMTHSPTLSLAGTYPGVILGTAGYMSPEQAKGFEADQRSDIFSFGCILYELLTGRQSFEGETASDILASVLKSEVDWNALPPRLNPRLIELLRRCLEKNPKNRWHAAADVRVEIDALIGRAVVVEEPQVAAPARMPFWKLAAIATTFALAGALVAGAAAWWLKPVPLQSVTRFMLTLPEGQAFTNAGRHVIALSPDGTNLVYVSQFQLYVRPLSGLEGRPIAGTQSPAGTGVINPAFSPDGQSIVFRHGAESSLKRVALSGGASLTICPADQVYGLSWHEDGIVFGQAGKGILRVSPNGGVPEVIASIGQDELADTPTLLPRGRGVMFSVRKLIQNWDQADIVVQPLGGTRKTVLSGGANAHYLPSGHLAYALGGVLLVVPFDLDTLTVTGGPVPMIEGVRRPVGTGTNLAPATAQYTISQRGNLAYVPGPVSTGNTQQVDLALYDRKGDHEPLKLRSAAYQAPRVSADGKWVVFETSDDRNAHISVYELNGRSAIRRLTFNDNSRAPIWSHDGQWIAFQSDRDGDQAIFRTRADGSGTAERLTTAEKGKTHTPQSWSPDGEHILFSESGFGDFTSSSLWVYSMKERKASRYGTMTAREATFSPDGRWVAYGTRDVQSATNVVFVEPFPATGAKYQLPQSGGHPVWSRKGDELITNASPTESYITTVTTSPAFAFGPPAPFTRRNRLEANPTVSRRQIDTLADGRIIGVLSQTAASSVNSAQIVVVLNWLDEVRQRVPTR